MGKFRKLTFDEIKTLLIAWREKEDEEALNLLATYNMGLVNYFAKKYLGKGLTFDELFSAGSEGLARAINKFNYKERTIQGFTSYITTSIENQIRDELRKYRKHSHVISFEETIGLSKDGDDLKIEDLIGTDADELIEQVISEIKNEILREALQSLTSREKQIILLRYGLDEINRKTQLEVAEIFGAHQTVIARQEQRALVKMRHPRNTMKLKDFIEE